jgi:outer membrane immunogenic protein
LPGNFLVLHLLDFLKTELKFSTMKKLIFSSVVILIASSSSFAQGTLGNGGKQFNAGVGFSDWGVPIYAGFDFGVHESVTIGPRLSFRNYVYTRANSEYRQSLTVLSFNGNYHFNKLLNLPSPWDFYTGLSLGYYFWSDVKSSSGNNIVGNSSALGLDFQVGGRYFFSDQFGVNLEFVGGTGPGGNFGITYKF